MRIPNGFVMDTVEYNDVGGWPAAANGQGASLALCDVASDNNNVANWGTSSNNTGLVVNGITIYADPGALSNCVTVGVVEAEMNKGFSVYPNPSTGSVSIDLGNMTLNDDASLVVYNSVGQQVLRQGLSASNTNLDLSKLSGIYFIQVQSGTEHFTKRLLVE